MSREVRRVPAYWNHPKKNGRYIPLWEAKKDFPQTLADWNEEKTQWGGRYSPGHDVVRSRKKDVAV
jgi:hypothetical protein